jgi:hypothetical protein
VPLHIVVVGGAGAGKSTVANLLSGAHAAEANAQAGFTRHPIAYTSVNGPLNWAGHVGFLGPLTRLAQPGPSSIDEDVYQVRRVPPDPTSYDLLKDFVVWDCPDMTTWAASAPTGARPVGPASRAGPAAIRQAAPTENSGRSGYLMRLLETASLADVLVYVASDERYNDEVPTQFLHLLLQSGKPVVVCLMKMREADAPSMVAHFQKEVVSKLPHGVVGCVAIPYMTPAQLADPAHLAVKYRIPLLNQVAVLGSPPLAARRRSVQGAMRHLYHGQEQLLSVARTDVAALQSWQALVQNGQTEFTGRYYREYLTSEKFRGFDEALVRLLELLELPGLGKVLSGALYVVRTPYRLLKGLWGKATSRPDAGVRPEAPVLEDALTGWLDMLRKEAARQAGTHPLWSHIAEGFQTGSLADLARERFQQGYRGFQMGLADEVDRTARMIYEQLEQRPAWLNTLRGTKFSLDAAAVAGAVVTAGQHWMLDFVLVPVYASVTQMLVEWLGKAEVDRQRELTRQRQGALMTQYIAAPLAEWLTQWPSTGGSSFERLQLALRRIPPAIQQLNGLVQTAVRPA